jgi:hypothetical protein
VTQARIDHLVVVAQTLEQGVQWCERTLGVTPGPGGKHPLMGTHNRLLRIATVDYPRAYLEIIAPDPDADPQARGPGRRWFDMDDGKLLQTVQREGPRLVHFVANVPDIGAATSAWAGRGIDRGEALRASRMTPKGLLQWRITVREDGRRLFNGCLPTLIEWEEIHPAAGMGDSGLALQSLQVTHADAPLLRDAFEAVGLHGVGLAQGPANLCATLLTPKGRVKLESGGI